MQRTKNSYKKSGVNIDLANSLVKHIAKISKKNVRKKNNTGNSNNIGAFGSLFDISKINIKDPLIVSSTDGVGTKLDLANRFQKFDTIGIDLVAMCVNDLIVQGAKPLFFLDYIAIGKLDLKKVKQILREGDFPQNFYFSRYFELFLKRIINFPQNISKFSCEHFEFSSTFYFLTCEK